MLNHKNGFIQNKNFLLFLPFLFLLIYRLTHLSNFIEEPSMWRQCDTFFYSYEFFRSGIKLLTPSVCWMGGYMTVALEFPIVSAVIAVFFKIFGEQIFISELVCLLFYICSVIYLYILFKLLLNRRIAYLISLVYSSLPLGLYYSRAVVIDFAELFFVFATLYYFVLWLERAGIKNLLLVLIFSALALLTKAPYVLIIIFPAIYEIYRRNKIKFFMKHLIFFSLPVLIFIIWQVYVQNLNSKAPDWYFIPGYFKFTNMSRWYFGYFSSRFDINNWRNLFSRFGESIATYTGIILFIAGLFINLKNKFNKKIFGLFFTGSIVYLLIFFDLNVIHDYYQIPFLCIASFYIAVSFDSLINHFQNNKYKFLTIMVFIIFLINCIWFTERWYYKIDKLKQKSSEIIKNNSDDNSLIIVSDYHTDPREPSILAPSLRRGWSVNYNDLSVSVIEKLKNEGAAYLLIILKTDEKETFNVSGLIEEQLFENKWRILFYKLD